MKKLNTLVIAAMTALTLSGGVFYAQPVSAADQGNQVKQEQQKLTKAEKKAQKEALKREKKAQKEALKKEKALKKQKKDDQKVEQQGPQRKLKPWEEKYYEQHPEFRERDAKKGKPDNGRNKEDEDGITWHQI